jgi:hypothetical protein
VKLSKKIMVAPKDRCKAMLGKNTALGRTRCGRFGREAEVPAETALKGAKQRLGHPAQIPLLDIAVLNVICNAIRKEVFDTDVGDSETMALEQFAALL